MGTVCNICTKNLELQGNEQFRTEKFDFVLPLTDTEPYKQETNKIAKEFRENIPPDLKDRYAAAVFHAVVGKSSRASLLPLLGLIPRELSEKLEKLQTEELFVGSINNEVVINGSQTYDIEVVPDSENSQLNQINLVDRLNNKTRLGNLRNESYQLPLGTKAKVTAEYAPPAQGKILLNNGEELNIGKMDKSETAGQIFYGAEPLKIELVKSQEPPVPILKFDGKPIGKLNAKSVDYLKSIDRYKAGVKLEMNLAVRGEGYTQVVDATSKQGSTFLSVFRSQ